MKKSIVILSMMAFALSACAKKEDTQQVVKTKAEIISQFKYQASNSVSVQVTEFKNGFNQECVSVHANYEFDSSKASVDCVNLDKINYPIRDYKIVQQLSYDTSNTPVQVTSLITKYNNYCTIVHANYEYQNSVATISCN